MGPAVLTSVIPSDPRYSTTATTEQVDTIPYSLRPTYISPTPMRFQDITVARCDLQPSDSPLSQWTGLRPETLTLSAGHVKDPGRRAFLADTLFQRDTAIPLRDGHSLRADIFRPVYVDNDCVPALVVWSPYGKTGSGALSPVLNIVQYWIS
jgi:predicted acyl esterase